MKRFPLSGPAQVVCGAGITVVQTQTTVYEGRRGALNEGPSPDSLSDLEDIIAHEQTAFPDHNLRVRRCAPGVYVLFRAHAAPAPASR